MDQQRHTTTVVICSTITDRSTFVDINKLASKVYDPAIVLPAALLEAWHAVNPETFWICRSIKDNKIVGYICAVPLCKETFKKTLESTFDEMRDIPPSAGRTLIRSFVRFDFCV
jgi:hypothetical protein